MLKKSPWLLHFDAGGCNGCSIEVKALATPRYDIERFGCLFKPCPRHADILIVTGIVTRQAKERLIRIYEQMPRPKKVIAVGTCAISGGIFRNSYNFAGPVDKIIPVDCYVYGCPPKPEAIIKAVLKILK